MPRPVTVSSPTVPLVVTHPYQGAVSLEASPAIDDRDACGWWAWVQKLALPQEAPGFAHEQGWISKAQTHWPGMTHDDAYAGAWERDRLCAELMSAELAFIEPSSSAQARARGSGRPDSGGPARPRGPRAAFRLRPAMQDALVRGLLTGGIIGSSDLCAALPEAPNVQLVRRLLLDDAINMVQRPDGTLERAPVGQDRIPRASHTWRPMWPGALHEVAEQDRWSSADAMIDLMVELGWPVNGVHGERTPLGSAVHHLNHRAVDALLRHGANPRLRPPCGHQGQTRDGLSAWDLALGAPYEEMLPRLLAAGVVPDQESLHQAVQRGGDGALALLLERGLDPFPPDEVIRPGRLPRLLRLAKARCWATDRDRLDNGDDGFILNHRRLEQIWLRRHVPDTASTGRERRRL